MWLISKGGRQRKEIAEILGISKSQLSDWVHAYNLQGEEFALDGRRHNGNELLLSAEQMEELSFALEGEAPDGGVWTGPKVSSWIRERFGVEFSDNTARAYMRRLDDELKTARPLHPKSEEQTQQEFQKKGRSSS
jgi:transposase